MRIFNTSGPCDPEKHYTVIRQDLIEKGQRLIEAGSFFTLFAPRQAGKTTYYKLLLERLKTQGNITLCLSFENSSQEQFYEALNYGLKQEFARHNIATDIVIKDQLDLRFCFDAIAKQSKSVVLVIDEFENIPLNVRKEIMPTFRAMYHKRRKHGLQSLILAGTSTLFDLILDSASPFNVTEQIKVPYFSIEEVHELINMFTAESGQSFDEDVTRAIYHNTKGQPGLVNVITKIVPNRSQVITMDAFYITLRHFLTHHIDENVVNIIQKAKQKREFMLNVLFGTAPIPFSLSDQTVAFLYAHGVIDNVDGNVDVAVPLYAKALNAEFRPLVNTEIAVSN